MTQEIIEKELGYETADGHKFKTFKEAKEYLQKTYPEAWEKE